jgi:hypothetical protein
MFRWKDVTLTLQLLDKMSKFRHLAIYLLISVSHAVCFGEGSSEVKWRNPENGGINVLYCYSKIMGCDPSYASLRTERLKDSKPFTSVTDLLSIADKTGMRLRAVNLNLDELSKVEMPIIVHMDGDTLDTVFFILILSVEDGKVYYMNGPSATITMMTRDDFRRVWSGIGLVPAEKMSRKFLGYLLGAAVGIICALLTRWKRLRNKP